MILLKEEYRPKEEIPVHFNGKILDIYSYLMEKKLQQKEKSLKHKENGGCFTN
jgi:hypothetical protein